MEEVVIGKNKGWVSVGGGVFLCPKKVCLDEFQKRRFVSSPFETPT